MFKEIGIFSFISNVDGIFQINHRSNLSGLVQKHFFCDPL